MLTHRNELEHPQEAIGPVGNYSGHSSRRAVSRLGKLELLVPPDRQGQLRMEVFERHQRSETDVVAAWMGMHVQRVSTHKVKVIAQRLCGRHLSPATIRRADGKLVEAPEHFARRRLEESRPCLIQDARQGRVRAQGLVRRRPEAAGDRRHRLRVYAIAARNKVFRSHSEPDTGKSAAGGAAVEPANRPSGSSGNGLLKGAAAPYARKEHVGLDELDVERAANAA